jgi:hypothetical protein
MCVLGVTERPISEKCEGKAPRASTCARKELLQPGRAGTELETHTDQAPSARSMPHQFHDQHRPRSHEQRGATGHDAEALGATEDPMLTICCERAAVWHGSSVTG